MKKGKQEYLEFQNQLTENINKYVSCQLNGFDIDQAQIISREELGKNNIYIKTRDIERFLGSNTYPYNSIYNNKDCINIKLINNKENKNDKQ